MSYGLTVRNNDNYLQIDSEKPRLCAVHNGTYQATSEPTARVVFSKPITTQEPPCIFVQNSPEQPDVMYTGMMLSGSPYNWTGFSLSPVNIQMRPKGKWFAAVFSATTESTYGMRLWDENGSPIYDTETAPVIVTKASHTWLNSERVQIGTNAFAFKYNNTMVSSILSDEYFMINPFSRSALTQVYYTVPTGVKYDWQSQRLQVFIVTNISGGIAWNNIGQYAGIFARLPGT